MPVAVEVRELACGSEAGVEAKLAFPIETVWRAIADEGAIVHWPAVTAHHPVVAGRKWWTWSFGLGYEAGEFLEVTPPRRLVSRGLYTRRLTAWELAGAPAGTLLTQAGREERSLRVPGPFVSEPPRSSVTGP